MTDMTWTFRKDAPGIKFLVWMWGLSPGKLNFCKLFWATVFALPALPFRLVVAGIEKVAEAHPGKSPREKAALKIVYARQRAAKKAAQAAKGGGWGERFLASVGKNVDRVVAFFQKHSLVSTIIYWTVALAAVVAAVWAFVWTCLNYGTGTALVFEWIGFIGGIALGGMVIATLFVFFVDRYNTGLSRFFNRLGDWIAAGSTPVGHGFRGVYRFVSTADHAIKSRSCPRIVLK